VSNMDSNDRRMQPAGTLTAASDAPGHDADKRDNFLQLMFFQASDRTREVASIAARPATTGDYAALRHSKAAQGNRYNLPLPTIATPVRIDSPATEVMTDLRRVNAVTIDPDKTIAEANRVMIAQRVRALFVADNARHVFGIITSTDILGERPIKFAQERGFRHDEIVVRDIMTPADRLEILDFNDVQSARVGDVIATLRSSGRQHALAVEAVEEGANVQRTVRGIFSLTQIARQLGIPAQQVHDIARTFAEIEAAIAS
jgi:CBS domain-containing protein